MKITIELSGGLEILFNKVAKHEVDLPDRTTVSLKDLLVHIKDHLIKERPDLFVVDGTVRPGILVLVNDCDWELLGGLEHEVQDGDVVVFISTLHGG
jgi:ubiquitin related modifier 1